MDGVEHGLAATAQGAGDLGRVLPSGAGEHDLAAAQDERISAAQPGFQRGTLVVGEGANIDEGFHATQAST